MLRDSLSGNGKDELIDGNDDIEENKQRYSYTVDEGERESKHREIGKKTEKNINKS